MTATTIRIVSTTKLMVVVGLLVVLQQEQTRLGGGGVLVTAATPSSSIPCQDGFRLPSRVVDHTLDLVHLIEVIREDDPQEASEPPEFDEFYVWEDSNDVAVMGRKDDACLAAFRGTDFGNPGDVLQLFNWEVETFQGCTFRAGIWSAYHSTYYDEFVAAIDDCMTRSDTTQLILGGHSQGGAIAVVASVDLKLYNPTVITFGATRSLTESCKDVTPQNHYRFINAMDETYDYWPMIFNRNGIHVGHAIYLDPESDSLAAYVGLGDNTNRDPTSPIDNHDPDMYFEAISQLIHSASSSKTSKFQCEGLLIFGWEEGHYCTGSEECMDGLVCIDCTCTIQ